MDFLKQFPSSLTTVCADTNKEIFDKHTNFIPPPTKIFKKKSFDFFAILFFSLFCFLSQSTFGRNGTMISFLRVFNSV
jgi:hypothetical protein